MIHSFSAVLENMISNQDDVSNPHCLFSLLKIPNKCVMSVLL